MDITEVEKIEEEIGYENSLYNSFVKTVEAIRSKPLFYSALFIFSVFLRIMGLVGSQESTQDDMTIIILAVVTVVVSILHSVFLLNFFNFSYDDKKFSFAKTLWDIPTYAFYSFAVGVLVLLGLVLFVIPGIYIAYVYSYVALVAILFDKEGESSFKITKNKVSSLGKTYIGYAIITMLLSGLSAVVTNVAPKAGIPMGIIYAVAIVISFFSDIVVGMAVSLFKRA